MRSPTWISVAPGVVLAFLLSAAPVQAQGGKGAIEGHLTIGPAWFLDEDFPAHLTVGGSLRAFLTDRLSVEPEFLYLRESASDQDYLLTASVAYDLARSGRRAIPYVMGGAGIFHHQGERFSDTSLTAIGGMGVKISLSNRIVFAPRFRVGFEPNVYWMLTGSVGFVLSSPAGR